MLDFLIGRCADFLISRFLSEIRTSVDKISKRNAGKNRKISPQLQRGDFTIFYLAVTNEIHIRKSANPHIKKSAHLPIKCQKRMPVKNHKILPQPRRGDFTIFYFVVTNEIHIKKSAYPHIKKSTYLQICTSTNPRICTSKNQNPPITSLSFSAISRYHSMPRERVVVSFGRSLSCRRIV